jgi:nitroreductase
MDPVEVRRLAGLTIDWLRQESTRIPQYSVFVDAWDKGQDRVLRGAPHLALTYADEEWAWSAGDCAIALTYFELVAHAHGLGTCWAGILTKAAANSQALAEALALPAGHKVFGAVMFGHPRYRYPRIPSRQAAHVQWR